MKLQESEDGDDDVHQWNLLSDFRTPKWTDWCVTIKAITSALSDVCSYFISELWTSSFIPW